MTRNTPAYPLWLGLLGLLPFWVLALGRVSGVGFGLPAGGLSLALAGYAATILSFLGGIRWGIVMSKADRPPLDYVLSVVPQLAGWAALALPDPWRFVVLALLVLGLGPLDRRLVGQGLAPIGSERCACASASARGARFSWPRWRERDDGAACGVRLPPSAATFGRRSVLSFGDRHRVAATVRQRGDAS